MDRQPTVGSVRSTFNSDSESGKCSVCLTPQCGGAVSVGLFPSSAHLFADLPHSGGCLEQPRYCSGNRNPSIKVKTHYNILCGADLADPILGSSELIAHLLHSRSNYPLNTLGFHARSSTPQLHIPSSSAIEINLYFQMRSQG